MVLSRNCSENLREEEWNAKNGDADEKETYGIVSRAQNRLDSNKYIKFKARERFSNKNFWWETDARRQRDWSILFFIYLPPRNASNLKCISAKRSKNQSLIETNTRKLGLSASLCFFSRLIFLSTMGNKRRSKTSSNIDSAENGGRRGLEGEITHENLLNVIADINAWHSKYPSKSTLHASVELRWVDGKILSDIFDDRN